MWSYADVEGHWDDLTIRAWATTDPQARAAVDAVDVERIRYLRALLLEAGVQASIADSLSSSPRWAAALFSICRSRRSIRPSI